jgi:hypothetical protein
MDLEISKEDADYMYNLVEKIVEDVGPRMSCSPQDCIAFLLNEIKN